MFIIVGNSTLLLHILNEGSTFQKLSHLGVPKYLLERGDNPEKVDVLMYKWGVAIFLLLYSLVTFTLCIWEKYVSLLRFGSSVFIVLIPVFCTKPLHHLHISDPF